MGLLAKLKEALGLNNSNEPQSYTSNGFNVVEYERRIQNNINDFNSRFDTSSVSGIRSITVSEARKYSSTVMGLPAQPEQVLFKKATEYKKKGNMDLAIECLKKANELMPYATCLYMRPDYERLVNYLVLAGRFEEARMQHLLLDLGMGSKIENLQQLKSSLLSSPAEREKYDKTVIAKTAGEERDREEYYWLLEHFPSAAPKSFSGYRRMKKQQTENYQKIVEAVKNEGFNLNKVHFWLRKRDINLKSLK